MSPRPLRATLASLSLLALAVAACGGEGGSDASTEGPLAEGRPSPLAERCAPDNGGITLPDGFCAVLVSEGLGRARHLTVAPGGEVFVALPNTRAERDAPLEPGGVLALRDADGDGDFDEQERWGENGGNDVLLLEGALYFAPDDAVLRYRLQEGSLAPTDPPDTIVSGLPDDQSHTAKSIALSPDGSLYVNIGAPSNACMVESRTRGSPGQDPCPQLETRAGIWRFDGTRGGQTQEDGTRFATGLRNVVALRWHPSWNLLYGAQHGRDQLHDLFPDLFTEEQNAEKPAEEFVRIDQGDDFGWPYCYYDPEKGMKVLAPEYGGDGSEVGRCAEAENPLAGFPAHWAPNDLEFYTGDQFPVRYQDGAFIAFHGSWNRAPLPQAGYNVVFVPMQGGIPSGEWEVFAEGFRADDAEARGWSARPAGLAVAPDGSLYVLDSTQGRLWRIVWRGVPRA
jgi:glucose/arabinose dehydrogenase